MAPDIRDPAEAVEFDLQTTPSLNRLGNTWGYIRGRDWNFLPLAKVADRIRKERLHPTIIEEELSKKRYVNYRD